MGRRLRRAGTICTLVMTLSASWSVATADAKSSHPKPIKACPGHQINAAHCHALVVSDPLGKPQTSSTPAGYGPAQFHGAYSLPTTVGGAQTIAIVDAYDDPTVKADLDVYDQTFGLPPFPTCGGSVTAACFQEVNQDGNSAPLPKPNAGWALEIALDVEIAHATCQNCKILLVETNTNFNSDLAAGVNTAARLGADAISNSYGSSEASMTYGGAYDHPGIAITASAGDSGYGTESPASFPTVIGVGGTTLALGPGNSYGGETVWSGTGSGCSSFFGASSWQTAEPRWSQTGCGGFRGVADVAADADPATGAAVYDTTKYGSQSGWFRVGGTSLSSPLIAAAYALAGNGPNAPYPASITYAANPQSLHDVTTGSNGACPTTMCHAGPGYDGSTGVGTPNGLTGF